MNAIQRTRQLARLWAKEATRRRVQPIRRLAECLTRDAELLATQMAEELGKPLRYGQIEVLRTAELLTAIAARIESVRFSEPAGPALLRRRPHGVVAAISPWNNPIFLALAKVVKAAAYGNGVIWKPAPEACEVSRLLFQRILAAGWPEGLIRLVEGDRQVAAEVMNHPAIGAVTLTGSSAAGVVAQEICARRGIPLQAELGGNNAAVVWQDAKLREAARLVAAGAFEQAGQRCTANRRVIVEESRLEAFLELLQQESAALVWGDPLSPETQIGPLVRPGHVQRIASAVERALADCPTIVYPQGRCCPALAVAQRAWSPPVVLCCTNPEAAIVQEETFGPVLVVQAACDWDHAMRLCNGVSQGLAAAVFTESRAIAERFLTEAEAGILKVNQSTADAAVDVPFGGWKASAMGPAEHGVFDLEFFTRPQTVYGFHSVSA